MGILLLPLSHAFFARVQLLVINSPRLYLPALRFAVVLGAGLNGVILGLLPGYFVFNSRAWINGVLAGLLAIIIYHIYLLKGPLPYIWGDYRVFDQLIILGYLSLLGGGGLGAHLAVRMAGKSTDF